MITLSAIQTAFRRYHDKPNLVQTELARAALIDRCLLIGDEEFSLSRGFAVQAALNWALHQLQQSQIGRSQRYHHVLTQRYLKQLTAREYARLTDLSEIGGKKRARAACQYVADLLSATLSDDVANSWRQQEMLRLRYDDCESREQKTLRFLAVFRLPLPLRSMQALTVVRITPSALLSRNLVHFALDSAEISLHPALRSLLLTKLTVRERQQWHVAAADLYLEQNNYLEAVYHLQTVGAMARAVRILWEQRAQIGGQLPIKSLRERLTKFSQGQLSADQWSQVKLLAGTTAKLAKDLDSAIAEYMDALGADDNFLRAMACYELGHLYQQLDVDAALIHLNQCQAHLKHIQEADNLAAKSLLIEAWIYIDQRPDFEKARHNLMQTQPLIAPHDDQMWSNWHSAWGEYHARQAEWESYRQHGWQAWHFAQAGGDTSQKTNTAYNLGLAYSRVGNFGEAFRFLRMSLKLATQAGNTRMVALSHKGIGSCYVYQSADFSHALPHYEQAYHHFAATQNTYFQATTCYDLTEAYLHLNQLTAARHFFDTGVQLAHSLDSHRILEALQQLSRANPVLTVVATARQLQLLTFLFQHGSLTKQQCMQLTGLAARQATRTLQQLCHDIPFVVQVGKGRATRYISQHVYP